jgi:DNA-binding transcriptional LysR family regulator
MNMERRFDDILLGSIELFCLAGDAGSFTAAANAAGVTPAAVSRSISRLEMRLGARLFVRSTRSIRLTEGGREYFEHCRAALNQLAEAERRVTGGQAQPSGTIRISAPTTYGHHRLLPMLPAFRELYPLIKVEAHISNRNIDLHEENFDVAIRFRAQPDSTMVARHLEDAELVVVASPAYLRRAGRPQALSDLEKHECIQFALPSSGRRIPWLFKEGAHEKEMLLTGGYSCSEDVLAGVTGPGGSRSVPDLSVRGREGFGRGLAGRGAEALWRALTSCQPALPPRAAAAVARARIRGFHPGAQPAAGANDPENERGTPSELGFLNLEIACQALHLPVAIARRIQAAATIELARQGRLRLGAPRLRFLKRPSRRRRHVAPARLACLRARD